MRRRTSRLAEAIAYSLITIASILALGALFAIAGYVLFKGVRQINWGFLTQFPRQMGRGGGILPTIIGTMVLTGVSLLIVVPVGIASAVYLSEYTRGGRVVGVIRFAIESLAGVPSIIFGLFGFAFLVTFCRLGFSVLSGAITLSLMLLPIIIRGGEEALKTVPDECRQASLALGATRWQTTVRVVLPSALPGLVTATMLGTGRAVGETAAVWLTAGGALRIPVSLLDPARPMTVHLYYLAAEGLSIEKAYGVAAVLLIMVFVVYAVSFGLSQRYRTGRG